VVEEALSVFLLGIVVVGGIYGLLLVSEESGLDVGAVYFGSLVV